MERSILFLTLVELVDAEDEKIEKVRNLDLPPEIDIVISILKPQVLST